MFLNGAFPYKRLHYFSDRWMSECGRPAGCYWHGKTCPNSIVFTTWSDLKSDPVICGEEPATNRLCYTTPSVRRPGGERFKMLTFCWETLVIKTVRWMEVAVGSLQHGGLWHQPWWTFIYCQKPKFMKILLLYVMFRVIWRERIFDNVSIQSVDGWYVSFKRRYWHLGSTR